MWWSILQHASLLGHARLRFQLQRTGTRSDTQVQSGRGRREGTEALKISAGDLSYGARVTASMIRSVKFLGCVRLDQTLIAVLLPFTN